MSEQDWPWVDSYPWNRKHTWYRCWKCILFSQMITFIVVISLLMAVFE